jgi:hypothetical protein
MPPELKYTQKIEVCGPIFFKYTRMQAMFVPFLAVNVLGYIPWAVIFLFTQSLAGVRLYYLKKRDECERIQRRLQGWCSHTTDGGKGYGYSFGYWYAASISIVNSDCGDGYTVYMIATEASFKRLTKDLDCEVSTDPNAEGELSKPLKRMTVYERTGSYANPWFRRRERDATDVPKPQQKTVIEAIAEHQKARRHTVVYLHGPPCTGKSMIGVLLANELGGTFCNTLKPWQPGDSIGLLYSEAEPTSIKPLVLVFDEFDSALLRIHEGIPPHNKIPTPVTDKPGWNHLLDEIQRNMYPDLVLILTSNRDPDYIRSLDPSYIRNGRVDLTFEMTEEIT